MSEKFEYSGLGTYETRDMGDLKIVHDLGDGWEFPLIGVDEHGDSHQLTRDGNYRLGSSPSEYDLIGKRIRPLESAACQPFSAEVVEAAKRIDTFRPIPGDREIISNAILSQAEPEFSSQAEPEFVPLTEETPDGDYWWCDGEGGDREPINLSGQFVNVLGGTNTRDQVGGYVTPRHPIPGPIIKAPILGEPGVPGVVEWGGKKYHATLIGDVVHCDVGTLWSRPIDDIQFTPNEKEPTQ